MIRISNILFSVELFIDYLIKKYINHLLIYKQKIDYFKLFSYKI
jgi:hypothetical protein